MKPMNRHPWRLHYGLDSYIEVMAFDYYDAIERGTRKLGRNIFHCAERI